MKHPVKSKIISITMAAAMAVSMAVPTFAAAPLAPRNEVMSTKTGNAVVDSVNHVKDNLYNSGSALYSNAVNTARVAGDFLENVKAFAKDAANDEKAKTATAISAVVSPVTGTKSVYESVPSSSAYLDFSNKIHGYSANYVNNEVILQDLNKATTDWAAKIMQVPGDTINVMTDSARKAVQNGENIIGVDEVITDNSPATIENALRSLGGWGSITYQPTNHSYSKVGRFSYQGNNNNAVDVSLGEALQSRFTDNQQTLTKVVNGQKGALNNIQSNLDKAKNDFHSGLGETASKVMDDINSAAGGRLNYTVDQGNSAFPTISFGK